MIGAAGWCLLIRRAVRPEWVGVTMARAPRSAGTRTAAVATDCSRLGASSATSGRVSSPRNRPSSVVWQMRSSHSTDSTGSWPTALSSESMTPSAPSMTALATSVASARVGRGLETMLSSICVATIAIRPGGVRRPHQLLLLEGQAFERDLDPEIPLGDHDPIRLGQDVVDMRQGLRALDLRDGRDLVAAGQSIEGSTPFAQIGPVPYERECHETTPPPLRSACRRGPWARGSPPQMCLRQEEASVGGDGAAMHDSGGDVPVTAGLHHQLHGAVSEQQRVPRAGGLSQPRERDRGPAHAAHRTRGVEGPPIPLDDRVVGLLQIPQTNLWALKVGRDRDRGFAFRDDPVAQCGECVDAPRPSHGRSSVETR